jgi:hypothetical protein
MTQEEAEGLSEEKLHEVLAAAVKAKQAALPEALAKSKHKAVARAAKKALYQLKSSGVQVQSRSPKGEQPNVSREVEELPALLSAISGNGERALFFVKARPGGGLDSYQAIVHDEQGILQLDRGEAQRSKYRRNLEAMRKDQASAIEVPLSRALEELAVHWTVNGRAKQPLPPEADSHLRRLGVVALPEWPALPAPLPSDEALAPRAGALLDERELSSWLPGVKHLQVLSARLDEVDTSPLQLTEAQKHEQRLHKSALSASELSPQERRVWAMRLWRSAELLDHRGVAEMGKVARAEAKRLFHEPQAPSRLLEKMFEKVVNLAEQARAQQLMQQQGTPQAPPAEKTTPGGLIVP